jgi:hypothetical protein
VTVASLSLLRAADTKPLSKLSDPAAADPVIELKGKLVPARPPITHAAFRTESGKIYTVLSNRLSSALFLDTNLQSKTLLLAGRVLPATRVFEVTKNLRSFHDGKVHELAYHCDICSITGTEPGECMCCREPVRLVEDPEAKPTLIKPKSK